MANWEQLESTEDIEQIEEDFENVEEEKMGSMYISLFQRMKNPHIIW